MDPTTSPTLQPADDRSDRLCAGLVIGGKYQLDRPLGAGGMGVVWYATHLGLDAPVAIKLLNAGGRVPARLVETFLHEAQAAAAVRHRNVVSTTDFGTDADGRPFMVMELLEGTSLAERFENGERLPIAELVDIVAQCLSGLAAVHAAGVLHRDLKPENVFLVNDGDGVYPKVIDFGISRSLSNSSPDLAISPGKRRGAMLTNDSTIRGTPHYMSPEQAVGLPDVDQRADVYAVGVILYEGLTGHAPYDRPDVVELLSAIAHGGAPPVAAVRPEVGPALSAVVEKAMALREDRYSDAREMRAALLGAISVTPPGLAAAAPRGQALDCATIDAPVAAPKRRRKAKLLTAAVGVVALALGFALWGTLAADAGDSPAQAQRPQTPRAVRAVRHFASPKLDLRVADRAEAALPTTVAPPPEPPARRRSAAALRATSRPGLGRVRGVFRDPGF